MLTKAEQMLLEGVRAGDAATWQQFVSRYSGRLTSYAVRSLNGNVSDAEDLVQEVFISFLKNINSFEGRSSLESWLFMILRRRMVDMFRRRTVDHECLVSDLAGSNADNSISGDYSGAIDTMTASKYLSNDESLFELETILSQAMQELTEKIKEKRGFRDIKIIELVFYAGLGNKQIAEILNTDSNSIAVVRHRCIEKLRGILTGRSDNLELASIDGLLSRLWREKRFTCPKRSTIGSWRLGSLDEDWSDYVRFHVETLGCTICLANLHDLDSSLAEKQQTKVLLERIYESSIGFLN